MITYLYSLIVNLFLFSIFISLCLLLFLLAFFYSRILFWGFWHITFLEYHVVCVPIFYPHLWLVCFFFSIYCCFYFVCWGFVLGLEMCFFCPVLFFWYFSIYGFREFFYIYLDEEMEFYYKTIDYIRV